MAEFLHQLADSLSSLQAELAQQLQAFSVDGTHDNGVDILNLMRRADALQRKYDSVRQRADEMLIKREALVTATFRQLLENKALAEEVAAAHDIDDDDVKENGTAVLNAVRVCPFISIEADPCINTVIAAPIPATEVQVENVRPEVHCSEEELMERAFNELPKHVKGRCKFADVWSVYRKLQQVPKERSNNQLVAGSIAMKDFGKHFGSKISGKSAQAIVLVLRSMNAVRVERDVVYLVETTKAKSKGVQVMGSSGNNKTTI